MISYENLPVELSENRHIVEGNVCLSLWKQPELFIEYPLCSDDFLTKDGQLLYQVGKHMLAEGYSEFDLISVETFLNDFPTIKAQIDEFGGANQILNEVRNINPNNMDKYYDELNKWNSLIGFHDKGFNILKDLDKFKRMTCEQVADYIEYQMLSCVKDRSMNGAKVSNCYISDDFFERLLVGDLVESVSINEFAPYLNYTLNGVVLGKVHLVSGHSGAGKSTFVFSNYVYPVLKQGESFTLISNELTKEEYIIMLLSIVLLDVFSYTNLTRKKLQSGTFTEQDKEFLDKARQYINDNFADQLKFVDFDDYDSASVIKIIRKLSKEGCRLFLFDTMKSDDSANERSWAQIIESSKQFQSVAKKNNIAIILTYQIASHSFDKRWLHRGMLSQGKQIIEVVHSHIMLRPIKADEFKGGRNDIHPFRHKKVDGKFTNERESIELDPEKKYTLLFVDKNRSGKDGDVIVYEFAGHYARFKEKGFCNPRVDT